VVAVVVGAVVALGGGAWLLWPLVNPFACDQAQQKIAVATDVVDQLPRKLVASTRRVNDCDSSNDGWVEVTVPDGMDVATVATALERVGWSLEATNDDVTTGGDRELGRVIDGREVEAVVYEPVIDSGATLITVEAR